MEVEDNLYSYSAENALSANQGRALRELIENVDNEQTNLENRVKTLENSSGGGSSNDCMTKIWS